MKTTHTNSMGGQLSRAFAAEAARCGRGLLAATAFLLLAVLPAEADTLYWDMNGTASGCGNVGGTWSTGGGNWNSGIAGSSSMDVWEDGDLATISAGNDGTGTWTITISGTVKTPRVTYGGSLDTGNWGGLVSIAGGTLHFQDLATGHITYTLGHCADGERTISSQISSDNIATGFSVGAAGTGSGSYVTVINNTANNWYGACDIRSGTLKLGAAGVIPDGSVVQTAGGAGILDMAGYSETVGSLKDSVTVNNNNGILTINSPAGETHTGVISGTGQVVKNGSGTWTIDATDTYSGVTTVTAGTLILDGTINSTSALKINSGGTVTLGASQRINDNAAVTVAGTLNLADCNETIAALNGAGSIKLGSGAGGTLTVGKAADTGTDYAATDGNYSGTISETGNLVKANTGQIGLHKASTYTGDTTINGGALSLAAANNCLPTSTDLTVNSGGTLNMCGVNQEVASLSGDGYANLGGGTLTVNQDTDTEFCGVIQYSTAPANGTVPLTLGSGALRGYYYDNLDFTSLNTVRDDAGVNFDFGTNLKPDGTTMGNTEYSIRWVGRVKADATDTYTFYTACDDGSRLWVNGILAVDNWVAQGETEKSSATLVPGGFALTSGQEYNIVMEYYEGGGGASARLRWSRTGAPSSVAIPAAQLVRPGEGALVKDGTGILTLCDDNTYLGPTTVSEGNLAITGSIASTNVSVASGATLSGTGSVYGPTVVNSGGTLSPGIVTQPIGTLTLGTAPTLNGTVAMQINKSGATRTADKVSLTSGTLTYGGTLKVTASGDAPALGDTFDLFDAGAFAGSFTLDLPTLPAGLAWDTSKLAVDGSIVVVCDGTVTASAGMDQVVSGAGTAVIGGSPTASGGSGSGYTYVWTPATGLDDATAANPTASPSSTTLYTVTVTDANGCVAPSASVTVIVPIKVCTGTSKEILLSGHNGTIQWETSPDYVNWTDLSGEHNTTLSTPAVTAPTYFRARVTSGTCASANSTPMLLKLTQDPMTWTGGNDAWNFSTTGLWQDGEAGGVKYCDSYNTYLTDSASVSAPAIALDTTVSPLSVVNNSTKDYTISGAGKISGSGGLTKLGSSTLTLNTVNDYSGATAVSGGRLLVNGAIGSGAVTVQTGATLGGGGAIGGDITVESGGVLDPGAAAGTIGTLTSGGKNVTLSSGSTTVVQVDRNGGSELSDQVASIGTFTAGGTLEVANLGDDLEPGDEFLLFSATSYTPDKEFTISQVYPNDDPELAWDTKALRERGVLGVHRHPKANEVHYYRAVGVSLKVLLKPTMYTNDLDGDTVVLERFTEPVKHGVVTTNATRLFYEPVNHEHDNFDFYVTDGRGGKGNARFYVWVKDYVGKVTITDTAGGGKKVSFYGIPGYCYIIERTPEANPTDWATQATVKPNAAGLVEWDDPEPLKEKAFYRARTLKVGETCP